MQAYSSLYDEPQKKKQPGQVQETAFDQPDMQPQQLQLQESADPAVVPGAVVEKGAEQKRAPQLPSAQPAAPTMPPPPPPPPPTPPRVGGMAGTPPLVPSAPRPVTAKPEVGGSTYMPALQPMTQQNVPPLPAATSNAIGGGGGFMPPVLAPQGGNYNDPNNPFGYMGRSAGMGPSGSVQEAIGGGGGFIPPVKESPYASLEQDAALMEELTGRANAVADEGRKATSAPLTAWEGWQSAQRPGLTDQMWEQYQAGLSGQDGVSLSEDGQRKSQLFQEAVAAGFVPNTAEGYATFNSQMAAGDKNRPEGFNTFLRERNYGQPISEQQKDQDRLWEAANLQRMAAGLAPEERVFGAEQAPTEAERAAMLDALGRKDQILADYAARTADQPGAAPWDADNARDLGFDIPEGVGSDEFGNPVSLDPTVGYPDEPSEPVPDVPPTGGYPVEPPASPEDDPLGGYGAQPPTGTPATGTPPTGGTPPAQDAPESNWLDTFQQGQTALDSYYERVREERYRQLDENMAARGLVGSSVEQDMRRQIDETIAAEKDQKAYQMQRDLLDAQMQGRGLDLEQQRLSQQDRQFTQGLAEQTASRLQQESQFARSLASQEAQNAIRNGIEQEALNLQRLGMDRDEAFRQAQATIENGLRQKAMELQQQGMDQDEAYRQAMMEMQREQWQKSFEEQQRQWNESLELQYPDVYGTSGSTGSGGGTTGYRPSWKPT